MIRGTVNAQLVPIVRLRDRGPAGAETDVETVVDTGFNSSLTLPPSVVAALGLIHQSSGSALLADGTVRAFDIYAAEVEWDGSWRSVLVWVVGEETLLGMGLLADHQLRVDAVSGGTIEITAIP